MTLDDLINTKSTRSDASLLDDCTTKEVADMREELVRRLVFREPTTREVEVADVLGVDVTS